MTVPRGAAAVGLLLSAAFAAQSPNRNWTDAAEYDLARAAFEETKPNEQIALLREWESRYPKTQFERDRLLAFALAYSLAGRVGESLARAENLLKLNPNDVAPLLLIVKIGPSLTAPTASQLALITNSAIKLQSITLSPPGQLFAEADAIAAPTTPTDPETAKVLAFIRDQREGRVSVRTDPNIFKNEVVRSALDWAEKMKQQRFGDQ